MKNKTQRDESVALKAIYERKAHELNLTQVKLAKEMDITQGSVGHFLNGVNPIPIERARQFAELLDCEIHDFSPRLAGQAATLGLAVGDSVFIDVVLLDMDTISVIKKIKGNKVFNIEDAELIYWPKPHSNKTIALNVDGAEAEPRLREGSLAYVDTLEPGKKGDLVAVIRGSDELVFAELKGNGYAQMPNPDFPDRVFKLKDKKVKVVGKVIGEQSYFK